MGVAWNINCKRTDSWPWPSGLPVVVVRFANHSQVMTRDGTPPSGHGHDL